MGRILRLDLSLDRLSFFWISNLLRSQVEDIIRSFDIHWRIRTLLTFQM